jgi:hypothetical protein
LNKEKIFLLERKVFLFKLIEIIEWAFRNWECFIERVDIEKYQLSNRCN